MFCFPATHWICIMILFWCILSVCLPMQVLGALLLLKFSFYNIIHIDIAGKLPKPNRVELSNMNTDLYPVSIKKLQSFRLYVASFYPHSAFVDTRVLVAHYWNADISFAVTWCSSYLQLIISFFSKLWGLLLSVPKTILFNYFHWDWSFCLII